MTSGAAGNRQSLVVSSRAASRQSLVIPSRVPSRLSRTMSRDTALQISIDAKGIEKEDQDVIDTLRYSFIQQKDAPPARVTAVKCDGIFTVLWTYLPTLPRRTYLFLGLLGAVGHGVATPIWSFFLSKLMTIVGSGGTDPSLTKFGLIVLALCAAQALADWFQLYFLYALAAMWTDKIRAEAYARILAQDKTWFDESLHSPVRIVQSLIKDVDDMRLLVASVIGKFTVFVVMVGFGIIWAITVEWRLTLIGVALAPVFAVSIGLNNNMISAAEIRNKAKREAVARTFYEVIYSHIES